MPQIQLPVFPNGSVEINRDLACRTEGEQVIYYNGHLPVFMHDKSDLASFRLFTAQLIVQCSATQGDINRAFGVPLVAIKRSTKRKGNAFRVPLRDRRSGPAYAGSCRCRWPRRGRRASGSEERKGNAFRVPLRDRRSGPAYAGPCRCRWPR